MNIVLRYIDLCRFKVGPADVPASQWLLKLTLLAYFLIGIVIGQIDDDLATSLATSLADTVLMIAIVWLLLQLKNSSARFTQTLTAMAGAGSFIGIMGIPIIILFTQASESQQPSSVVMLLMIALLFWNLMVTAHIFRKALEIKPSSAALLTVSYTVLSIIVVGLAKSGVA